jgi:hypothetical protein
MGLEVDDQTLVSASFETRMAEAVRCWYTLAAA